MSQVRKADEASSSTAGTRPLENVRVFDFTHAAVGPWCTMLLAALGAEVIKVEAPAGDLARGVPPFQQGMSVLYQHGNLGKRAIYLDLKAPEDREVAEALLASCDIFVENMRPGKAESLGLGWDDAIRIKNDIIYCSVTGFGDEGPMRFEAGADPQIQAFGGWCSINGPHDGPWEMYRYFAHIDLSSGAMAAEAILYALLARDRSGQPQQVELSMLGVEMNLQTTRIAEHLGGLDTPRPLGAESATCVPSNVFVTENREYLAVTATTDLQWRSLCDAVGLSSVAEREDLATNAGRLARRDEVNALLADAISTRPLRWWEVRLRECGVPHSRVIRDDFDAIRYGVQTTANDFVVEVDSPWGTLWCGAPPWRFDHAQPSYGPPPIPGSSVEDVAAELGITLSDEQVRRGEAAVQWDFAKMKI